MGLRVWEFIFALLTLALVGNMIDDAFAGNPAIVNYTIFVAAFGVFTLFYLTPASFNVDWSGHPAIMILLDALNAVFFLTCGIALAAKLECRDCSNDEYTKSNSVTDGSVDREKRCREAQASVAFLWFAWAGFTGSMILSFAMLRQSGGARLRPRTGAAPARAARPSMAQV